MRSLPVSDMTVNWWIHMGLLRLPLPGTGSRRVYPDAEVRAMRAIDSMRRLAGVEPVGVNWGPAGHELARIVAEVARSNPPGTVVELPSKSPLVRHVLVVPEPFSD